MRKISNGEMKAKGYSLDVPSNRERCALGLPPLQPALPWLTLKEEAAFERTGRFSEAVVQRFEAVVDLDAEFEIERRAYEAKRVDWTGFRECQAVRVDDGRTGVITVLGIQGCGLIHVDLKSRQLLGRISDAVTPNRLTPLEVDSTLSKELKILVNKVHGKSGSVHRVEDLLAKHLSTWSFKNAS